MVNKLDRFKTVLVIYKYIANTLHKA